MLDITINMLIHYWIEGNRESFGRYKQWKIISSLIKNRFSKEDNGFPLALIIPLR